MGGMQIVPRFCRWVSRQSSGFRAYHDGTATDRMSYRVDMRSDTLTVPSARMRQAMAEAAVGDDVYGEDPTVNELQNNMAKFFGKEAALFVPTGTMGNLICVMTHCEKRGMETLLGHTCHLSLYEQGGISQIGGVHPRTLQNHPDGTFDIEQLKESIRPDNDAHYPVTRLICLENTHNFTGGKVLPLDFISKVRTVAEEHGLGLHLDGARVMNAAVALGVPTSRAVRDVDTVSMCFSKGIGAPVGSIVAGTKKFIHMAHRMRKALGGGMRQAGVLAAAAQVAMEDAEERLSHDHEHAKQLAHALNEHGKGIVYVDVDGVHSNIIMADVVRSDLTAAQICDRLNQVTDEERLATKENVVVSTLPFSARLVRIVTNCNISQQDVQLAVKKIKFVMEEIAATKLVSS